MDNLIEVGSRVDVGPLQAGMQQAAQAVQQGAQQIGAATNQMTSAVANFGANSKIFNEVALKGGEALKVYDAAFKKASESGLDFAESMEVATGALRNFESQADKVSSSGGVLTQTRLQLQAIDSLAGIRIPRAMTTMLAKFELFQALIPNVFAVAGAGLLIQVVGELATKFGDLADAAAGWTKKAKDYYKELVDENTKLFMSVSSVADGQQKIQQINVQIEALNAKRVELANAEVSASGTAAGTRQQEREIEGQILDLERTRRGLLDNLVVVTQREAEEKKKLSEQGAKDAAAQAAEELREAQQLAKAKQRLAEETWQRQAQLFRETTKAQSEAIQEQLHLDQEIDDSLKKQMEDEVKAKQRTLDREKLALRESLESDVQEEQRVFTEKQQQINAEYNLHLISIQKRADLLRQAATEELQIEQAKIQAKIALDQLDPDKPEQLQRDLDQMKKIQQQYNAEIGKINDQARQAEAQKWSSFFNNFRSTFESTINGLAMRTETLGQAVSGIFNDMLGAGLKFLENLAINWVEQHVFMALFAKSTQAVTGVSEVMSNAAIAASAAYASAAAIPIVGWTIAPGAAAAAYSEVSAFAPLASAAGGWADIPSDQLAMVHKNEMVLPAELADRIRSGNGGGHHFHFGKGSVQIGNVRDADDLANQLIPALKRAARHGKF